MKLTYWVWCQSRYPVGTQWRKQGLSILNGSLRPVAWSKRKTVLKARTRSFIRPTNTLTPFAICGENQ